MIRSCLAVIGLLLLAAAGAVVAGERGIIDPTRPLRITAALVVADERRSVTTYSGDVQMTQAHAALRGDRVVVHLEGQSGERYEAQGEPAEVTYLRESGAAPLVGRAREMYYDMDSQRLDLLTTATLDRGADHLEGDRIAYFVPTDRATVTAADDGGGRIRATFYPPPR